MNNPKTIFTKLLLTFIIFVTIPFIANSQKGTPLTTNETCELQELTTQINACLSRANSQIAADNCTLTAAEIKLEIIKSKSGGGGFKIFVKASKKWESEKSTSVTFSYKIPEVKSNLESTFTDQLYIAIIEASKMYAKAKGIDGLEKDTFKVEVAFSINKKTEGGIEFEVWGIGLDASGELNNKVVHTITLEFKCK